MKAHLLAGGAVASVAFIISITLFSCQPANAQSPLRNFIPAEVTPAGIGSIGLALSTALNIERGLTFGEVEVLTALDRVNQIVCGTIHVDGAAREIPFIGAAIGIVEGSPAPPKFQVVAVGMSPDQAKEVRITCRLAGFGGHPS